MKNKVLPFFRENIVFNLFIFKSLFPCTTDTTIRHPELSKNVKIGGSGVHVAALVKEMVFEK